MKKEILHKHFLSDAASVLLYNIANFNIKITKSIPSIKLDRSLHNSNVEKIISEKLNLIYLVMPLCASRSIISLLKKNQSQFEFCSTRQPIRSIKTVRPEKYHIFTVVRNPWKRLVSCFNKRILNCNSIAKTIFLAHFDDMTPHSTFEEFIENIIGNYNIDLKCDPHWASQTSIIKSNVNLHSVDDIVRIKNISKVGKILNSYGAKHTKLPKKSTSKNEEFIHSPVYSRYHKYYEEVSSDNIQMIKERYKADAKNFNYDAGGITSQ
ncbi:sulfotransferase family 2 domain-containing protein [Salinibacter ruber]|uniref:Sulfotransferase family protein n=1 Tax=Salinibacter ruber TaxID=146919 RepID=A0AAW5P7H2_9BACT|nr:hypothetical protein [Salinibacter ruber]